MSHPLIILRKVQPADESALLRAIDEFSTEPDFAFAQQYTRGMPINEYIRRLDDMEKGINLDPSYVPATILYAFVGDKIVGRASIRHRLNDFLSRVGGHIGYGVVPSERRKGYATEILRQSLSVAKHLGLARVLLTCDDDNVGSIRTIEKNNGILETIYSGADVSKPKRRYWIDLLRAQPHHGKKRPRQERLHRGAGHPADRGMSGI